MCSHIDRELTVSRSLAVLVFVKQLAFLFAFALFEFESYIFLERRGGANILNTGHYSSPALTL